MSQHQSPLTRPSIRESQKATTLKLLLEASEELFTAQGYGATTIGQIAERAGASRATFYLHFEAKWRTVAELQRLNLLPETLSLYHRLDGYEQIDRSLMRSWIEDAVMFYVRHKAAILYTVQAMRIEPDFSADNFAVIRFIADEMPNYLAGWGLARREEAYLRLALLIVQVNDFAADWLQGAWDVDQTVLVDVLTDLWMGGLGLGSAPTGGQ